MTIKAKYVHTNLIAKDWRALAGFYEKVFGCKPVPPERRLTGKGMEAGTSIPEVTLRGIHLRLPGCGPEGPTLEIFTYAPQLDSLQRAVNRPGFAHIAFRVDDVRTAYEEVLATGGSPIGEIVTVEVKGRGTVTWCYLADPEGNILELQSWA
ncbi:MAG: VOC family protein [Anaerolineales bacterium]|nr:VOC family protein [Anaerolineales bacterium]